MKKIILILLITLLFSTLQVKAATTIRTSASRVVVGEHFKVKVTISGVAAWNLIVTPSGPVTGCSMHEANVSDTAENINKTFEVDCKATALGTINLVLTGDTTTENDKTSTVNDRTSVTVVEKPKTTPTPTPTPQNNRSSNTNLKSIKVGNYTVTKKDETHYVSQVPFATEKVKISAQAESSKATVEGAKEVALKLGTNTFKIVVTAENKATKNYYIEIIRKNNQYSLNNLPDALKSNASYINLERNEIIFQSMLEEIQDSGKKIEMVQSDKNNKVLYKWIINGKELKNLADIITTVSINEELGKISDEAMGTYVQLKQQNKFPKGVKLAIPTDTSENLHLYSYTDGFKNIKLVQKRAYVEDDYVMIVPQQGLNYFITEYTIKTSNNLLFIIAGSGVLIALLAVIIIGIKNVNQKEKRYEFR